MKVLTANSQSGMLAKVGSSRSGQCSRRIVMTRKGIMNEEPQVKDGSVCGMSSVRKMDLS